MFYPDYIVEEVRQANDIVGVISQYTALTQKGGNYFGLCPFHREKTPSFSVSPDKQLYHCFGCGASGSVVTFVMQKENFDYREAIVYLAERIRYTLPEPSRNKEYQKHQEAKQQLLEIHVKAARYFHEQLLSASGSKAQEYLDRRGMSENMKIKFGLGYSSSDWQGLYNRLKAEGYENGILLKSGLIIPDKNGGFHDRFRDRLIFPIFDVYGKVVGFGGRIIDAGEPKYLNSPETQIFSKSKNLYGINFARQAKTREYILVEGYMDVIALHQQGFSNSCASLGTAFNLDHANVLKKYCDKTVLLFDSDEAGEKAAIRAIAPLSASGLSIKVLQLTGAKDPDEFLKLFGREKFLEAQKAAENQIMFQLRCMKKAFDLSDPAEKSKFASDGAVLLAKLPNSIEREVYIKELSKLSEISIESLNTEVEAQSDKTISEIRDARTRNRSAVYSPDKPERKNDEARRAVLSAIAMDKRLAEKINDELSSEELVIEIYKNLYNLLYERYDAGKSIYPAELINNFEDIEEQKVVSHIYSDSVKVYEEEKLIDALNDWLGIIKLAYIKFCMDELMKQEQIDESWYVKQQNLTESKSKLEQLVYNHHRWIK